MTPHFALLLHGITVFVLYGWDSDGPGFSDRYYHYYILRKHCFLWELEGELNRNTMNQL
jgi:hypothetical protein